MQRNQEEYLGVTVLDGTSISKKGWQPAYPEVTGYITPTFFDYYHFTNPNGLLSQRSMKIPPSTLYKRGTRGDFHINYLDYFQRAIRMADWEIEVQMKNGAVQGGTINEAPSPAILNHFGVVFPAPWGVQCFLGYPAACGGVVHSGRIP